MPPSLPASRSGSSAARKRSNTSAAQLARRVVDAAAVRRPRLAAQVGRQLLGASPDGASSSRTPSRGRRTRRGVRRAQAAAASAARERVVARVQLDRVERARRSGAGGASAVRTDAGIPGLRQRLVRPRARADADRRRSEHVPAVGLEREAAGRPRVQAAAQVAGVVAGAATARRRRTPQREPVRHTITMRPVARELADARCQLAERDPRRRPRCGRRPTPRPARARRPTSAPPRELLRGLRGGELGCRSMRADSYAGRSGGAGLRGADVRGLEPARARARRSGRSRRCAGRARPSRCRCRSPTWPSSWKKTRSPGRSWA